MLAGAREAFVYRTIYRTCLPALERWSYIVQYTVYELSARMASAVLVAGMFACATIAHVLADARRTCLPTLERQSYIVLERCWYLLLVVYRSSGASLS
jgi:hypothetical protein